MKLYAVEHIKGEEYIWTLHYNKMFAWIDYLHPKYVSYDTKMFEFIEDEDNTSEDD